MPFIPLADKSSARDDKPRGFIPLADAGQDEQENGAIKTMRAIGNVYPVAETAANLATQGVALPVAGLAGLGALATNALGLTDADPASVVHTVGGALTYQPKSELGQHLTEAAMYPFTKLQEVSEAAGDKVFEVTDSPAAATATRTAIEGVLPMVAVPAARGARRAVSEAGERKAARANEVQHATAGEAPESRVEDAMSKDAHIQKNGSEVTATRQGFIPLDETKVTGTQAGTQAGTNPGTKAIDAQMARAEEPQAKATVQAARSETETGAVMPEPIQTRNNATAAEIEGRHSPEGGNADVSAIKAGGERLADDASALPGTGAQGFSPLRREGDQGLPGVDGELRAVPEGHGAGADATALAGQAGRAGELRAGELRLDDPAATGEAPHLLQAGDAARPDTDGGRSSAFAGAAESNGGAAAAKARSAYGEPASREVVPPFDVADIQQRDPAIAGMGAPDRASVLSTVGQDQARMATGSGHDAAAVPQPKSARYALIEADDIRASHNADLRPTEGYPAEMTRPDWTRADADQRVQGIVRDFDPARLEESLDDGTGAPIVLRDGTVEAGNARAIAMQRVYQANGAKADTYRQHLRENAGRFGLQPEQVDSMKAPVLVRMPDQPDSATLAARGEPDTLNSWAPGANYVPLVDDARAPASKAKTVADLPSPIRRENIITDFAKGIGTSIYEGRVKGQKRLGFFRPRNEEVRIKRANDLEVTAHEVAHLIDSRVPAIANAWRTDKALREELKSVSYDQKSVKEGFAEGVRLFLTQPEALEAKAPKVYAWLESFTNTHEYGPALRKAQADMTSWFGQDALNRARSKIGTEKPLSQHLDGLFDRMRQATVDDLHGIYKMERDLTGKISPAGPYESARLSRAAASISDGAVRYGHPVKQPDGSFTFKGKGLEEILKPVSESLDDAMLYFVGRSARELQAQGREHLFTPAETDAMLKLATPERKKAFEEYQAWNRGVLDFAEAQGVINSEARAAWQRTQYLPFHRVGQSDGFKGAKPGDWSGIKALTGGTENIKDVLANMVQNAAQLVDKAVKNEARVKIADLADKTKGGRFMAKIDPEARPVKVDKQQVVDAVLKAMGINRAEWRAQGQNLPKVAQRVVDEIENSPAMLEFMVGNQPPAGMNVVAVLRNGKPEWYEVGDPLLYRALSSIDRTNQHWLIKWLGLPKRVGQASITLTPDFWVANLARDTIMGSIMSRAGFKPVIDSLQGMRLRMLNDPVYKDYIANGGGLSSIYLDESKLRAKLEKFYSRQGIDYRTVLDTPDKLLGFVETLGDAFEMSTRLGEFKKALAAGENPRHAAYQGREVSTDFAMRGDSQALGMMYDTVMFLKPAVLSWDRLARGLAHDPNRGAIAIKAGALAMASAGLYLLNRDDPRYQDLPEWDRDANWHFFVGDQHFRYPKIWEIGALSSAAERTVERTLDENPENLGKDFTRILGATFNLNLMPQIMAPVYEQATNRNRFTGAPIETPGMENIQPFLRAKPGTSETMKAAGMATADLPEGLQVNPARAEALLRGYFNTWAMYGLMLSDQAFFDDHLPEKRTDELPVVRRFYANAPARHTKYEEQFYDLLEESKRLRGTMRELDRIGRQDIADRKEQDPRGQEAKPLERAAKNLQEINAEMRLVRRDSNLTPEEKRALLDELTIERNALIKAAVQDAEGSIKEQEHAQ